ncbi:(d)CMP kinase [Porticoccus litoralis]|jgi:cytidylate kinase|uniref:(d)CMP kinase n=1 Tax=Porticoccus litoralis TaxID=434086 RepID=UPI0034E2594D
MIEKKVPVITIDGPSGSGKGTICQLLAARLGYHYLDSGALYRLLALAAKRHGVAFDNVESLAVLAAHMDISFRTQDNGDAPRVMLEGEDVSSLIRTESVGTEASLVAAFPEVRTALLQRQRAFAVMPGLVADGRDMGTVVFTDADAKIFLTASPEERAERRYNQLIDKGESVSLAALVERVRKRDERDMNRKVSPMVPAANAILLDSTGMSIDEVLQKVVDHVTANGIDLPQ